MEDRRIHGPTNSLETARLSPRFTTIDNPPARRRDSLITYSRRKDLPIC